MSSTSSSWRSSPPQEPQRSGGVSATIGLLAGVAVPDRQPVPPPELARDAPGPDVLHPVEVDALVLLGDDPDPVALDDLDRGLRQLVHAAEPLQRDQRLDPLARAMRERAPSARTAPRRGAAPRSRSAATHRLPAPPRSVSPANLSPAASVIRPSSPITVDLLEAVGAADLEVVRVVAGGDLQRPGAELGIDVLVGDDRKPAPDQRQDAMLADQRLVALDRRGSRRPRCRRASSRGGPSRRSGLHPTPRRDSRCEYSVSSTSRFSTSRSEIAEREPTSQLTM